MQAYSPSRRTAVVFSGTGVHGAYHAGVLKAFHESGVKIDVVAGGETAGIPFSAWIADRLDLPMLYVRKKAKGFGRNAQIEGHLQPGQRVLLVEDLTTDGRSKVNFCKALREAGADRKSTRLNSSHT